MFGKLPAHGDFVALGLTPAAEAAWDGWAGAALTRARETLGDGFEAAHDAAPPWRFVARFPGEAWSVGALACSVDRVGRRYLAVLGWTGLRGEAGDGVQAARAEAALYQAMAERLTGAETLDRLAQGAAASAPAGAGWWIEGEDGPALRLLADAPPADLLLQGFGLVLQAQAEAAE